jgi:diacylglycerol kinase (ATP)
VKKLLLIVNPRAGKTQSRGPLFDAVSVFSEAGYLVSVHNTTGRGDATQTAAREGAHYDLVVCSGGDGTLNETITGLMQLEKPPLLGYLPRGSTNDFATSLKISSNPVKAALAIAARREQVLDVGQWNQRYFTYVASFGAFTRSSYSASQAAKNALGHFAYILEGMKDLDTLRPYKVRLNADGDVLDGEYLFGAVCNSTSIGGLMRFESEHVVLDDGRFEMLLVPNPRTPLGLQNLLLALVNQHYHDKGLIYRHVSRLTLEPEEDLPWSLDGEYAPSAEKVDIVNRQGALTMLL